MLYKEHRCPACNKLLFKGILVDSEVEVKCRGCGSLTSFHGEPKEKLLCFKENCPNRQSRSAAAKEGKAQ
ncbi:MAG: hypothetical protein A3C93_02400 [Candidatus Lloydbacteria bacterium RIFCSPHIGHO2_02_FULL_54_17]|uniref:Com family DNA-binding transcriptional regulator n=1 Tax=Candidatus Lloydbacteria bacterium RIFCSPHIGHO2_02_FULL_54_17 TaxID=1798664 RepID=A0A1G2DDP8_9BACT|nr:MAG: hypothetical protein A2762_04505 [Candidatus Lloydbacteria bacterium RIFCSPHIGHO2_01_FULL_54_11]OGZ11764.1 MAG: hypothetical protein A3C93_02400 [Candidatus Lloydbacteria bacterium RIFCSPHIGHO2_02_FULL_54_17]OGZ14293.1 MAG: hypothetical protein A2948_01735 [Candidatus Lloydbacteria bacterium RIFCSPLOWO2_01_FULL_54_18]OGZ16039.1 MAG: hypothetical protein A3H76_00750 [Candidatus Lloydbacteria bacterium RIFCSPLOWO2_02_FULL_54_12]